MLFPAFVKSDAQNGAYGYFPGINEVTFRGGSLDEAIKDAQDALSAHFNSLFNKGVPIPFPKSVEAYTAAAQDQYQGGAWVYVELDVQQWEGKAERFNVTLPMMLVRQIDAVVNSSSEYRSRSAFLAAAARRELSK